jgi:fucose permease
MSTLKLNKNSVRAGIATIGVLGGFVSGYGVLVPYYIEKYSLDLAIGGRIFALTGLSGIVGVFIATYFVDKIRGALAGSIGTVIVGIGIGLLVIAPTWNFVLFGVVIIGVSFGIVQVAIGQLVVDVGGIEASRRANKNNIGFATASILVPSLFGLTLLNYYAGVLSLFIVLAFIIAAVFYSNTEGQLLHKPEESHKKSNHKSSITFLLLGISAYVGLEASATGWIPSYLLSKGWSTSKASLGLSVFFISLLAIRLVLLKYIHKLNFGLVTLISVACLVPALLLLYATDLYWLAIIFLGASGGPVFSMAFAWVVKISPGNARITGFIFFSSISGSMIFPYLIGVYMNKLGAEFAPLLMMIPSGLALVFFLAGYRSTIQQLSN